MSGCSWAAAIGFILAGILIAAVFEQWRLVVLPTWHRHWVNKHGAEDE